MGFVPRLQGAAGVRGWGGVVVVEGYGGFIGRAALGGMNSLPLICADCAKWPR